MKYDDDEIERENKKRLHVLVLGSGGFVTLYFVGNIIKIGPSTLKY